MILHISTPIPTVRPQTPHLFAPQT